MLTHLVFKKLYEKLLFSSVYENENEGRDLEKLVQFISGYKACTLLHWTIIFGVLSVHFYKITIL